MRKPLIRRYDFSRVIGSWAAPTVGRAWRAAGNLTRRYFKLEPKATRTQTLLLFADDAHLELLRENLWTLAHSWRTLPRLCVVGDIGANEAVFHRALTWWPNPWNYVPYEEVEVTFEKENRDWIVKFGRHHIFGRKLAAALYSAQRRPTLYSDGDILWLGEPEFLDACDCAEPFLMVSTDPYASYCEAMIGAESRDLMKPPYTCAGLFYLSGWPWPEAVLEEWVNRALALAPHPFAEQTIVGFLARRYGGYIPRREIAAFFDDWWHFLPGSCRPLWSARHYFGPVRHHFHRDALLLRWGILRRARSRTN